MAWAATADTVPLEDVSVKVAADIFKPVPLVVHAAADWFPEIVNGDALTVGLVRVAVPIVGEVPNTARPLPVSSLITPNNCADVVAANTLRLLPV